MYGNIHRDIHSETMSTLNRALIPLNSLLTTVEPPPGSTVRVVPWRSALTARHLIANRSNRNPGPLDIFLQEVSTPPTQACNTHKRQ
jgi:hypothetical protein